MEATRGQLAQAWLFSVGCNELLPITLDFLIFHGLCVRRQVDPVSAPIPFIAEFILHLFMDKKLASGTCQHAVLLRMIVFGHMHVLIESLYQLCRGFALEHTRRLAPQWNQVLVLDSVLSAPYKPLNSASLKHLMASALCRRQSEINVFSSAPSCLRFNHNYFWVILHTDPTFLTKNQVTSL